MELLYLEEHTHCANYTFEGQALFKHFKLKSGEEFGFGTKAEYMFVFMLRGALKLTCFHDEEYIVKENEMLSLGYGIDFIGKCLADTELILLVFDKPQVRCDEFSFIKLKKYLPPEDTVVRRLQMVSPIVEFLNNIIFYISSKMYCRHLQDIKQSEWFFLMRAFYTKEENAMFFAPLIEEKNNFTLLLKEKAPQVGTVQELAEACNMTTKTPTRNFKKYFDTTPKKWLQLQRKPAVRLSLLQSKDKIKILSNQLGFSSGSHLNLYCRKYMDKSPREIKDSR